MRTIGIDLAWGRRNTTAAVALERENGTGDFVVIAEAEALTDDDSILDFVRRADTGGGLLLGIDAPLDVPNETGERPVEALLRRCFGRYQAGAHPANRRLYGGDIRGERLALRLAAEFGISNDFEFPAGDPEVRRCLEVFPHPAQVVLFELTRTLKYKARSGRDLASRHAEFARLVAGLCGLRLQTPSLRAPDWLEPPTAGLRGMALKRYEDRLDALVCAYVAAYFWQWGESDRCTVIGDRKTGYVVTPITPALRACLEGRKSVISEGSAGSDALM
jgi:predicted RNase H-like nuclease